MTQIWVISTTFTIFNKIKPSWQNVRSGDIMTLAGGHPFGLCLLLLLAPASLAQDPLNFEIKSFNSSVVELSCSYNGDEDVLFNVYKDGRACINYASTCQYYVNDCKFLCKESNDSNVMSFLVNLNRSCQESFSVRCSARSVEPSGNLILDSYVSLTAQSDTPVISITDDHLEAGSGSIPIECKIANRCENTEIEITAAFMTSVELSHTQNGDRYTTIATTHGIFNEPGNYTITCKEKGKGDNFAKSTVVKVHEKANEPVQTGSGNIWIAGVVGGVILITICLVALFWYRYCWTKRHRKHTNNRSLHSMSNATEDPAEKQGLLNRESGPNVRKKYDMLHLNHSICGIWVKEDDKNGRRVLKDIKDRIGSKVHRADIEKISFVQEDTNYAGYFALISSESLKSGEFMTYLTSVIVRIQNGKNKHDSTFVLVLLEVDILSKLHKTLDKNFMNNLQALPSVNAFPELDETCLLQISDKVKDPPLDTKDFHGFGNTGVGLAWSYFCGYLSLILPGMKERIEKSEIQKNHSGRMNPRFIIIIPESGRTPGKLNEIDRRFSSIGPLDDGIKKSRAGHPKRPYKNFVHQIKKSEDDRYYFCGEYATPIATLDKLCVEGKLNEVQMKEQQQLFTQTLQSILQSHPNCGENVVVFTFKDVSTMTDQLCNLITTPNQPYPIISNPIMQVTRVAEGLAQTYYYGYLTTIGPRMAERIVCDDQFSHQRMPTKFFILLPFSCYCHPTLDSADEENIKKVGNLKPLVIDVAGNNRSYDTAIHSISAHSETYLACVEYCTPVLVMYEMAKKENLPGLSPVQIAAELRVLYEILYDLLHGPSAPEYCRNFELVYYDDNKKSLSEILVEKIKESLTETTYENQTSTSIV